MIRYIAAAPLAEAFGYTYAVLFGRARSAVAALLREFDTPKLPVILPSNVCPDLYLTVEASGAMPCPVSVSADSGLASDAALAAALCTAPSSGLVMPCHLYGAWQAYPQCFATARATGWFILENDTLLATMRLTPDSPKRASGDALLLSFGYAKTIELGLGGALLTDDPALAAALWRQVSGFPIADTGLLAREAMSMLERRLNPTASILPDMEAMRGYAFPEHLDEPLCRAIATLPQRIISLQERYAAWSGALSDLGERCLPSIVTPCVPWRWIGRLPQGRDVVVTALRHLGFDVGTNFPPVWWRCRRWSADAQGAQAERWGREVLNLWLTDAYDLPRIRTAVDVIAYELDSLDRV